MESPQPVPLRISDFGATLFSQLGGTPPLRRHPGKEVYLHTSDPKAVNAQWLICMGSCYWLEGRHGSQWFAAVFTQRRVRAAG